MEIEFSNKLVQVRVYSPTDRHNYQVSFYIFLEGARAILTSLEGKGFYQNFEKICRRIQNEYGINIFHGTVLKIHEKAILRYFRGLEVRTEDTLNADRDMVWLTVLFPACKS